MTIDLSHPNLSFTLAGDQGLATTAYGRPGASPWVRTPAASFTVVCDGLSIDARSPGLTLQNTQTQEIAGGAYHTVLTAEYAPKQLQIETHVIVYAQTSLTQHWLVVRNQAEQTARITRLDSVCLDLAPAAYEIMYYTSGWGQEFESVQTTLQPGLILDTRRGRSSQGHHPWFALFRPDGEILSASVLWSGNWVFRFEGQEDGAYRLSGGLHDWEFHADLAPGESIESAPVALVLGAGGDLNSVSIAYGRVGRRFWYPHNRLSARLPVEWNHWWSYEDKVIDEDVFRQNADVAAPLGIEVCTLDAGWFGPTEPDAHWYHARGDWDLVNTVRFPRGIRAVADDVHKRGMRFGLWCEIEGLGKDARLAETHPEFVARHDGERIGCVCFGNPAVQEWAFQTLDRLITDYACDWIKLDFNLDPGAGCNRTDHGHGAGDGLYAHYRGYYHTLARIRARHPEVILESCSSGGLRIDLGLLQQTHMTFLSDPDWPEHDLQLFWGASTMLAPNACLHWSFSEWIHEHPRQTFNPRDPKLTQHQFDYFTATGMLGVFGISQKLPELPGWVAQRLKFLIHLYRTRVASFVRDGDLYRLTDQPKRDGRGARWTGFQYSLAPDDRHLLFAFRLDGSEAQQVLHLRNLQPDRRYRLNWLLDERVAEISGRTLMEQGLAFTDLPIESVAIIHLETAD
jgi:alpha-galactosidase